MSDITKTSKEWYVEHLANGGAIVLDPDGWDRTNYEYSFNEELITKLAFDMRVAMSTVKWDKKRFIK